ncbi:hypothetical protein ACHAPU_005210 [Fusarium lateritium]
MSWRMMWHMINNSTSRGPDITLPETEARFVHDELPTMNIWGDIMNDYALLSQGHSSDLNLSWIYGVDGRVALYLATYHRDWKEIETIEDIAGLTRAGLIQDSVSILRQHLAAINKTFKIMFDHGLEGNNEADNPFEDVLLATIRSQSESLRISLCKEYLRNNDGCLRGLDNSIDLDTSSDFDALGC